MFQPHRRLLETLNPIRLTGRLKAVTGLTLAVEGLPAAVGSLCSVCTRGGRTVAAQVIGVRDDRTLLMPLHEVHGVAVGDKVHSQPGMQHIPVGPALLGRIINGLGRPIDQHGRIHPADFYPAYSDAPPPLRRCPIDRPLATGVRAIDSLLTIGAGQRIGIFSGAGVGKSVLLGMVSRFTAADVAVVALVGERGREVGDFINKDLGPEALRKTVMVVSTSDESPVMRVRACFVATAVAEYFRDQGAHVLLLMDSLTRLAMAQRQIGLAGGEPPASKGYTPSVFSLLPRLLERAGKTERGSMTGFYTVLVEGDDQNEPVSDAVRGILDGHIWLSRSLAGKAHYPAIDVLNSISRLMVDVVDEEQLRAAQLVRSVLGAWSEVEDLVNIGAYAAGSNPQFDLAVKMKPAVDEFLQQGMNERLNYDHSRAALLQLAERIRAATPRPQGQKGRPLATAR